MAKYLFYALACRTQAGANESSINAITMHN